MDGLIKRLRDETAYLQMEYEDDVRRKELFNQAADVLERCREVMREVEWPVYKASTGQVGCKVCNQCSDYGHAPDCKLAAAIKAIDGVQDTPSSPVISPSRVGDPSEGPA